MDMVRFVDIRISTRLALAAAVFAVATEQLPAVHTRAVAGLAAKPVGKALPYTTCSPNTGRPTGRAPGKSLLLRWSARAG